MLFLWFSYGFPGVTSTNHGIFRLHSQDPVQAIDVGVHVAARPVHVVQVDHLFLPGPGEPGRLWLVSSNPNVAKVWKKKT